MNRWASSHTRHNSWHLCMWDNREQLTGRVYPIPCSRTCTPWRCIKPQSGTVKSSIMTQCIFMWRNGLLLASTHWTELHYSKIVLVLPWKASHGYNTETAAACKPCTTLLPVHYRTCYPPNNFATSMEHEISYA